MQIVFDQGETRHVKLKIKNIKNEPFQITTAEYEFFAKYDRKTLQSGQASIVDHVLDVVITPPAAGYYILKYTYIIGDETLVDIVEVVVT